MFEQYVTIACVSNEVGGKLVGNAKWTGVRLRDVLDMAGVQASRDAARRALGRRLDRRHADGLGDGPGARADDRAEDERRSRCRRSTAIPARLIVPGLYGYVSATKWLTELELTTLEAFNGYWVPLGWAKEAPILTQSRIDTPRGGVRSRRTRPDRRHRLGARTAASRKVEVAIDGVVAGRAAVDADLGRDLGPVGRRLGRATPGPAHDRGPGDRRRPAWSRTSSRTPPAPDGARGWHTIQVDVG